MQNNQTNQPTHYADDERVHGFLQDLAAALNRITGKNIQANQNCQGLPQPVPGIVRQPEKPITRKEI